MKLKYKAVMFLTLLIFCVGSVCATDSDNVTVDSGLNSVNSSVKNTTDVSNGSVGHIMTDKEKFEFMDGLYRNNTALNKKVKNLHEKINKQGVEIKYLNDTLNHVLEDNKALKENNKKLNERLDKQDIEIKELNNKLDLQLIEIKGLQADKDKLNAEIKENYKKLLESPKKEDYEQLKIDIADKDNKIKELNTKIETLNNILNINKNDVINSLKDLSSTKNIQCGKYTFKLDDYLKIPLIKNGKKNILKFKKDNGRLPKYVMIAGYKVPQNVYQKLYNL